MSRMIKNYRKNTGCEQRTDHSEKIENKVKEVVVVSTEFSAIAKLNKIIDTGAIL